MALTNLKTTPPALTPEASAIWRALLDEYEITDVGGLQILVTGLEAFTRMRDCQSQIKADGTTCRDRFGQLKAHPLLCVERDSRAQILAALKQLNLDLEPLRDGPGPPEAADADETHASRSAR